MTEAYAVIRVLTNNSDQTVSSVELTTVSRTAALAKYHEILADAVVKASSGRLADGAYIVSNTGAFMENQMFRAPEPEEE